MDDETETATDDRGEPRSLRHFLTFAVPTLLIVGAILFGVNSWLGGDGVGGESGRADGEQRRDGPPPSVPDQIGFHPEPGSYLFEVRVAGESPRRTALDIALLGDEGYRITTTYHPPEPYLDPIPAILTPHLGRIRLRIDIGSGGHIVDVTGPDDYFETLEEQQPGLADPVRRLLLEEQTDAHYNWQLSSVLSQPAVPDRSWSNEAAFLGFGKDSGWTGVLSYSLGLSQECGAASPDELCIPVTVGTQQSSDGSSVSGTLWVGEDSGMQWSSELVLRREGSERRIRTTLRRR